VKVRHYSEPHPAVAFLRRALPALALLGLAVLDSWLIYLALT